jgi:glutamate synthase (NADPH) small chain
MGKVTGFIEWQRLLPTYRPVSERVGNWNEFYLELSRGAACASRAAAAWIAACPFCQPAARSATSSPTGTTWSTAGAGPRPRPPAATNNFPEFTGRVCPAPCEEACTLGINTDPVTIKLIEKAIIEHAFSEGLVGPGRRAAHRPPRRRGRQRPGRPGLRPAAQSRRARRHRVRAADRIGGLLRYGIPDFKMEKWTIDRRLEVMEPRASLPDGADIGGDPVLGRAVRQNHDAVLMCHRRPSKPARPAGPRPRARRRALRHGLPHPAEPGERRRSPSIQAERVDAAGKHVVIIGGGDTGSDCIGTSHRQGAASVTQIELLPRPPEHRADTNPWPQWPMIFRTSSSQEEGGDRKYALLTKKLTGKDGRLTTLHAVTIEVAAKPGGGLDLKEVPGTEVELPCDLLLLAMGFLGPETDRLAEQLGVELDARGNVKVDESWKTSVNGVFAAGDAQRGQSLIVWAISDGREAARAIDAHLHPTEGPYLPTRGIDQPFGGR